MRRPGPTSVSTTGPIVGPTAARALIAALAATVALATPVPAAAGSGVVAPAATIVQRASDLLPPGRGFAPARRAVFFRAGGFRAPAIRRT